MLLEMNKVLNENRFLLGRTFLQNIMTFINIPSIHTLQCYSAVRYITVRTYSTLQYLRNCLSSIYSATKLFNLS